MHKINIVVDIDNTLADTQGAFLDYIVRVSGRSISPGNIRSELRGDGTEWYEPYAKEFIISTNYHVTVLTVKPYPISVQAMELLGTLGDIHIVSSRINNWHNATHQWLEEHRLMTKVSSVHLRDASENSIDFKKRIVSQLQADYLFDDSTDIALGLRGAVDEVYLIRQPWNEELNIDTMNNIKRHDSLLDAAEALAQKLE
jgi:5'(3')-deoxyribonucleotidase